MGVSYGIARTTCMDEQCKQWVSRKTQQRNVKTEEGQQRSYWHTMRGNLNPLNLFFSRFASHCSSFCHFLTVLHNLVMGWHSYVVVLHNFMVILCHFLVVLHHLLVGLCDFAIILCHFFIVLHDFFIVLGHFVVTLSPFCSRLLYFLVISCHF